jgi:hypothetical protein
MIRLLNANTVRVVVIKAIPPVFRSHQNIFTNRINQRIIIRCKITGGRDEKRKAGTDSDERLVVFSSGLFKKARSSLYTPAAGTLSWYQWPDAKKE